MVKEYGRMDKGPMEKKPVVTPIDPDMLSYDDKRNALEEGNLIEEKINGIVKGRTCTDVSFKKAT